MRKGSLSVVALLSLAMSWLVPLPADAQTFPSRPVRIAVPFPPGSGTDLLARLLAEQLSTKWSSRVYVENLSGAASGNVGAAEVARAAPDGHTLMLCPPGPISTSQLLYKNPGYDASQWTAISLLATVPYVLLVGKDFKPKSVQELIAFGRANPGKLNYASPGVGATGHLSTVQFEALAGLKMVAVPYRGIGPARNDVLSGQVDMMFDVITTSLPLHHDGKAKILAVGSTERAPELPDVPTIAESGLPGFRSITWFGLVAPPGTPEAIADKINKDVTEIINSPDVRARIQKMQMTPVASSRPDAVKFFKEETELWGKVIRDANISLD
jgi:tripartite-type tricarboxylate transporter receptor subunit TctC